MFVIVDDNYALARITHVPLFGNKVEIMACFYKEDDALNTLYEMERLGLKGHHVENIGPTFIVEPEFPDRIEPAQP